MILGVIPARNGSKGIIGKNMYPLNGKPLIYYTIDAAHSSFLEDYVITTDIPELMILNKVIHRPPNMVGDNVPMIPVIQHAVDEYERENGIHVDAVCLLQPTSPLRDSGDINLAFNYFELEAADSLYSGYYMGIKRKDKVYDKHKALPHFQRNGAIFIAKRELIDRGKLWSDDVIEFEMPLSRSIDIDTIDDMRIAEAWLKYREAQKCEQLF